MESSSTNKNDLQARRDEEAFRLERIVYFLIDQIFKYCKSNPGRQFHVPIQIERRCSCYGSENSGASGRCMNMVRFPAYNHLDKRLKAPKCKPCIESEEIPF